MIEVRPLLICLPKLEQNRSQLVAVLAGLRIIVIHQDEQAQHCPADFAATVVLVLAQDTEESISRGGQVAF